MKLFTIAVLLFCVFPSGVKSQAFHHPKRNNDVKLFKEGEIIGEGILYDLTDSAFILYDDNRISKYDTVIDKSLLKSFSFKQVQLVKINPGSGLGSLLIGGFIGGAVGSLAGFGVADVSSSDQASIERSHDQLVGFVAGFIIGGIAGAIPGYIHGNNQRKQVWINYNYSNFISERDNMKPFCFRK
jgi:hypothetical protein